MNTKLPIFAWKGKTYGSYNIVTNEIKEGLNYPPTSDAVAKSNNAIKESINELVTTTNAINQNLVKSIEINVGALELKNSENGLYYNVYTPVLPSGSKIINAVWTSGYDGGVILGIAGDDVTFHSPTRHTINTSYANITIYYI